ncbi:hypothetical protein LAZ67_12000887 [Cordylochernes scorpioides]|uniref:Maturase K n=1 Tax=Cordylochernes scorpioides TaxID=51811 RepID=A0ABY6L2S9_9ARAC|nr:hypothetical protein LAZ67_12000887 [Cordylochernes scorpioides]
MCLFFFLISTQQSYQGIKPVELFDGVCWGGVSSSFLSPLNNYKYKSSRHARMRFLKILIWASFRRISSLFTQQLYQGIKPVELFDGVCWVCVSSSFLSPLNNHIRSSSMDESIQQLNFLLLLFLSPLNNHIRVSSLDPSDLQDWIFGRGLDDDALAILASAQTRVYKYFLGVELRRIQEDSLLVWRRTLSRWRIPPHL